MSIAGHDHGADEADHDEHAGHDHGADEADHDEHAGHDHGAEEADHDEHAGHDHGAEEADHDEHAGHDHGAEEAGGIEITPEMAKKIGIQIHEAEAGSIAKMVTFPAEIKLNRDRAASVSPRYAERGEGREGRDR